MRRDAPDLRIIDDALWSRARARREAQKARSTLIETQTQSYAGGVCIKKTTSASRAGRPNRYLFSGILKCEACGCSLIIADPYRYACGSNVGGKDSACAHKRRYVRTHVEQTLLGVITGILTPAHEERFRKRLASKVAADSQKAAEHDPRARIAALTQQIDRCAAVILDGLDSPTIRTKLREAEAERERLMRAPVARPANPVRLVTDAAARYREMVRDLPSALAESPERGRERLSRLFGTIPVGLDGTATVTLEMERLLSLVSQGKNTDGSGGRI